MSATAGNSDARGPGQGRFYVYTLAEVSGRVFYVGKGSGRRMRQHVAAARKGEYTAAATAIRRIWAAGGSIAEPQVILRTNDEQRALAKEQAMIALIGASELVNGSNPRWRPECERRGPGAQRASTTPVPTTAIPAADGLDRQHVVSADSKVLTDIARLIAMRAAWAQLWDVLLTSDDERASELAAPPRRAAWDYLWEVLLTDAAASRAGASAVPEAEDPIRRMQLIDAAGRPPRGAP